MRIGVIGYDFPHRKSQEVLLHCFMKGIKIECYLASPWKKLSFPSSSIRTSINDRGLLDLRTLCAKMDIEYIRNDHESKDIGTLVLSRDLDLSIISGARILGKEIIEAHNYGILNFHPAKLPQYRGLDCHFWSILEGAPLGVTSHLIDYRMDCGKFIQFKEMKLTDDETIFDINIGLINLAVSMIDESLDIISKTDKSELPDLPLLEGSNRKIMTDKMVENTIRKLPDYLKQHNVK